MCDEEVVLIGSDDLVQMDLGWLRFELKFLKLIDCCGGDDLMIGVVMQVLGLD